VTPMEPRTTDLARIQAAYPAWRITKNILGVAPPGFTAVERATGRRLAGPDLAELEAALMSQATTGTESPASA
jgi:hypothetical protein